MWVLSKNSNYPKKSGGGRTRFEITLMPSIFSQIIVVPATIIMKLRNSNSMACLKYRTLSNIYLIHHIKAKKFSNTEYRYIVRPHPQNNQNVSNFC